MIWTSPSAPPDINMYITTHNSISALIQTVANIPTYGLSHRKLKTEKLGKGAPRCLIPSRSDRRPVPRGFRRCFTRSVRDCVLRFPGAIGLTATALRPRTSMQMLVMRLLMLAQASLDAVRRVAGLVPAQEVVAPQVVRPPAGHIRAVVAHHRGWHAPRPELHHPVLWARQG